MENQIKKDVYLIEQLGGPTAVAKLLGYELPFGVQRVSNWRARGIPAKVKVEHPDLFFPQQKEVA